ncbi:MAG: halocarboxylic acid dehydrogenase DehI family protein [Candidatus Korobacteraceae bacterium]
MSWKRGNRLRLVTDDIAPPRTREIFDDVRKCLGLPTVPVLYRAYAAAPEFLELHWQAFRPVVETRQFFLLSARLAAECYTRAHNYFEIPALRWRESGAHADGVLSISQVLDYYQYLDPLLLLIAATQMQAFEGPIGESHAPRDSAQHSTFPVAPALLKEKEATSAVQRVWDERRRILDLAFVSDEHHALACWPEGYLEYWSAIKHLLRSPLFADCQYRIAESAYGLARELPVKVEMEISQVIDAGIDSEQVSLLVRIHEALVQGLTGLMIDITFARIGCEGGTRSGVTPSPQTRSDPAPAQKPPATEPSTSSPTRAA